MKKTPDSESPAPEASAVAMQVVIVSGLSGSGKSTAIHVLEDLGFYCIDNLPVMLMYRIQDGKIAQFWMSADSLSLLQQLGAVPVPA